MNTSNPASTTTTHGNRGRKRAFIIFGVVIVVGAVVWLASWLLVEKGYESTDDAYINSDLVQITSEVPGTVLSVRVDDTQSVERGTVLAELDPADAKVATAAAEAQLARAVRSVRGLFAQRDQLRAQIVQRQSDVRRAQEDVKRREGLLAGGAVSGEELSHSHDALAAAQAALDGARQGLNATEAQIEGTSVETHPQVLDAEAAVRNAALALRRTQLKAPVAGVIARRSVQIGQHVAAGAPLMGLVPLEDVWVDANFKEGQLRDIRVGQPVSLHADLYGSDVEFHGKIAGLSAGSGSAFALLPAQNASGNWIKIVQRVPVRIEIDPKDVKAHPLRVGLSMTARVDVHDTSGPVMATQVRSAPLPSELSEGDDPQTEARIQSIIAQNAGAPNRTSLDGTMVGSAEGTAR